MNEQIDALLRQLADEDARVEAPPRVENAVMRQWDWCAVRIAGAQVRGARVRGAGAPVRRCAVRGARVLAPLAAAAVIVMSVWPRPNVAVPQTSIATPKSAGSASMPAPAPERSVSSPVSAAEPHASAPRTVHREPRTPHPARSANPEPRTTNGAQLTLREPRTANRAPRTTAPFTAHRAPRTFRAPAHREPRTGNGDASQGAYVLVGASQSDPAPLNVVRLRMSRSSLATLGLPLPNPEAAALVDVDVFVGEDGVARAIRPVALVSSVSQE
jgi:hypothetical protein